MKKLVSLIAATVMLFSVIGVASAAEAQPAPVQKQVKVDFKTIHFIFDGKELIPPDQQNGFIYQNSTYVPLRFISYSLNKAVKWDASTNTVSVLDPSADDIHVIREYNQANAASKDIAADASKSKPAQIKVTIKNITYLFQGASKQPAKELPGLIYNNSIYVPMRFFSESMGKQIGYVSATSTVSAKSTTEELIFMQIINEADVEIAAFRAECTQKLFALVPEYIQASDAEAKEAIIQRGEDILTQCDTDFDAILAKYTTKLTEAGLSNELLNGFKASYEKEKAEKRALVDKLK